MKSIFLRSASIIILLVLVFVAYSLGFYQGYNKSSYISSEFRMRLDEHIYNDLENSNLSAVRNNIKTCILIERDDLKRIDASPIRGFFHDYSTSKAAEDNSDELHEAEVILQAK